LVADGAKAVTDGVLKVGAQVKVKVKVACHKVKCLKLCDPSSPE